MDGEFYVVHSTHVPRLVQPPQLQVFSDVYHPGFLVVEGQEAQ